jgi:protoheme ferro-lyase
MFHHRTRKRLPFNTGDHMGSFGKGSPLLNITLLQAQGVKKVLANEFDDLALEVGMR